MGTRCNKRNVSNFIKIVAIISACLVVDVASGTSYAQESKIITRERLIAALKDCKNRRHCKRCRQCKLKASDFIREVKQLKVDFDMSDFDKREIREAGSFLSEKELDELIVAVRNAYLFPYLTLDDPRRFMSLEEIAKDMDMTLFDSYGDVTIDSKIRLIHASVNNTLRLDTSYKFYDGHHPNMFVNANVDKNHPDGTLFIGREFIKQNLTTDANSSQLANDSVLYFLISHQISHLKQAKIGWTLNASKQRTLHADFLAGWWVARFLKTTRDDSPEYQAAFFKIIDLAFRSGSPHVPARTHGTPKERLDAVSAGFGLHSEADPDKVYRKGIEYVSRL